MSFGLINEIFSFKGVPLTTTAKTHNRKFYVKVGRSVWCKQGTSTALHCDLKFNHTSISSGIQILTRYLSVFLKTSMKPQRFGCLLLIRYLFKFNFSKLAQLTILQAGFEKNSILYINPDFWVPLRNFFLNLGALSIKHARGFKVSTLIFLKILPLFDQKIAKYGLKNAFWSWKQQLWTVDFDITKIHGVSPLHLYSNVYIGFFLLLNIYEGVRVLYVCVRLAYFWKVCEARFSTFFQKFLGL